MNNKKILLIIVAGILVIVALGYFLSSKDNNPQVTQTSSNQAPATDNSQTQPAKKENKLCDWIDQSDIIIKLNFADGVVKDTSYETGFFFEHDYFQARLAREACDYRVGFNYKELVGRKAGRIGVRGYSDNIVRQLAEGNVSVQINTDGKPDLGSRIEVTVKN